MICPTLLTAFAFMQAKPTVRMNYSSFPSPAPAASRSIFAFFGHPLLRPLRAASSGLPLLLLLLLLGGCQQDACERLNCQNGGRCMDGACACPEGFAGLRCELAIDPCAQLSCVNGSCQTNAQGQAACACEDGFEGGQCQQPWTQKFLGAYTATETCNSGGLQFKLQISPGLKFKQVVLENFHNQRDATTTAKVVAELLNERVFDIPSQYMAFGLVSGSGSINEAQTRINLNYDIIQGSDTLRCAATLEQD